MYTMTAANVLERMRHDFPLQARLEIAEKPIQESYTRVLQAWIEGAAAPSAESIPAPHLEWLVAMDAVTRTPQGLSCYPFSATETGIRTRFGETRCVHAMCAIDALAISGLVGMQTSIEAFCAGCRHPVSTAIHSYGTVVSSTPTSLCVIYQGPTTAQGACCHRLCPGIGFLCATCLQPESGQVLTLEEALFIGRKFFAFQSRLPFHISPGSKN